MKLSERLRSAMEKQQCGLHIHESFIKELEEVEDAYLKARLATSKACYECQDFNDPPFCTQSCVIWSLRFALNVKDVDIWGPAEDDESVESSYAKAQKV